MTTTPSTVRIALCITELDPGGAERCLVALARRLDRRRFEPVVYCLGPRPKNNPTSLADALESAAIPVQFLNGRGVWQFPALLARLRRELIAQQPQIVQCFLFHANVLGAIAARRAGVPHVLTGIRVAERQRGWHVRLARLASRGVERHVCVSQSVRDFARDVGRLPSERLVVIPNGVDVASFASAEPADASSLGVAPWRRLLVCIGRLEEQKGLDRLIGLLPEIFRRLPEHDLLLVGEGPLRVRLEVQATALGLAPKVHFLGYRGDVPRVLAASQMLLLPSRWEGMPNVVLEAMAAGKPVVATNVEGVAELLGPLAERQMIAKSDDDGLVNAICAIAGDTELARSLGEANQRRVAEHFSLDAMALAYQRLYESLLATETPRK